MPSVLGPMPVLSFFLAPVCIGAVVGCVAAPPAAAIPRPIKALDP